MTFSDYRINFIYCKKKRKLIKYQKWKIVHIISLPQHNDWHFDVFFSDISLTLNFQKPPSVPYKAYSIRNWLKNKKASVFFGFCNSHKKLLQIELSMNLNSCNTHLNNTHFLSIPICFPPPIQLLDSVLCRHSFCFYIFNIGILLYSVLDCHLFPY